MSDPYVLKNGVFILKGGKAGSGVPLESHVIPHGNTSVGAKLDELSQNLTLSYDNTSYSGQQDINSTLQAILEKVYPNEINLITYGTWTTGGQAGATVSQSTVLTTNSGTSHGPSFTSPEFYPLDANKALIIQGTITTNWNSMAIDAYINGTWTVVLAQPINGDINKTIVLPQGTTQVQIRGYATVYNATDTYTKFLIK